VQQVLANPWRRTESAGKPSQRNSNRTSRRIKASFTRVIDPTLQRINFNTLLGRRHPQVSHQRTGPHTGLSLAEEPESRSNILSGKVLQRLSFSSPPSWLFSFTWIYVIGPGVTSPETTRSLALGNFFVILITFLYHFIFFYTGANTD
jgi:hypothetical protein